MHACLPAGGCHLLVTTPLVLSAGAIMCTKLLFMLLLLWSLVWGGCLVYYTPCHITYPLVLRGGAAMLAN